MIEPSLLLFLNNGMIPNTQDVLNADPLRIQMVVAFRGKMAKKEWIEEFSLFMEKLNGEPEEKGFASLFNCKVTWARFTALRR